MVAVVHPDAIGTTVAAIKAALPTFSVGTKVPNPRPDRLVTVRRTGGPRATRVSDLPQITVEVWAPTDIAAHDACQLARAAVTGLADGTNRDGVIVYRVDEFAGPADLPDPLTPYPRWTFTVSMHVRAAPAS